MPPREIDGGRRGACSAGHHDRCGRGTGSRRLVPGTGQRRNVGVQQPIERMSGVYRRLVQHMRASITVMTTPGMHQNGNGMTCCDYVVEHLHFIGLHGLAAGVTVEHCGHRLERRHRFGQQLRHRDRRLEYQRRMDHVAEIENAADRPAV